MLTEKGPFVFLLDRNIILGPLKTPEVNYLKENTEEREEAIDISRNNALIQ